MAETKFGFQIGSSLATQYLTDSKYVRGTYMVVPTLTDRNNLPVDTGSGGVIVEGSLCYVQANDKFYLYSNSAWVEWTPSASSDDISINKNDSDELQMGNFEDAELDTEPVKVKIGSEIKVQWKERLSQEALDEAVEEAQGYRDQASSYATNAGTSEVNAAISAQTAQQLVNQTMSFVNNKFWWGTQAQYNQLEQIYEGTYYFIIVESE